MADAKSPTPKVSREIPKRVTRSTVMSNRSNRPNCGSPVMNVKTKNVLALLCLFDGLRTPSIRRLVRRPRILCDKPILTFDPSFYAPSSIKSLSSMYNNSVECPSEIVVDPSVQNVLDLLRKHATSIPPHRVLIHYFGHGCYPPSDGNIYFFSDDRDRYKPLKISTLINSCACPMTIVMDCPNAASAAKALSSKRDTFGFFACGAGESLPLSTSAPIDLFSSCLFDPYKVAMWYKNLNHCAMPNVVNVGQYCNVQSPTNLVINSNINNSLSQNDNQNRYFLSPKLSSSNSSSKISLKISNDTDGKTPNKKFLKPFFMAILESICFETQDKQTFEMFTKDPAVASMFKGFALAQRVMMSYNLHPTTIPELKPMTSSILWSYWEVAVDASSTLSKAASRQMIFDIFMKTFSTYPTIGTLPIFSFFLKIPEVHDEAASRLFVYMDTNEEVALAAARTDISKSILSVQIPSSTSLAIVAKIIAASGETPFAVMTPTYFVLNEDDAVIASGMAAITLAASIEFQQSFKRLIEVCLSKINECAPFSLLLFGILMDKTSKMAYQDDFTNKVAPLLDNEREDIRASALYALSFSKNPEVVQHIINKIDDNSPIVRLQCLYALLLTYKLVKQQYVFEKIDTLDKDTDRKVKEHYMAMKPFFAKVKTASVDQQILASNPIIKHLAVSIKQPGFEARFDTNIFDVEIPLPLKPQENRFSRINNFQLEKTS